MGRPGDAHVCVDATTAGELLVSVTGDAATAFRTQLNA